MADTKEKSRIICTVSNDLSYDRRMLRICNSLTRRGYQVTLAGREKKDSAALEPQDFAQKRFRLWSNKGKTFYFFLNCRLFFFLLFSKVDIIYAVDLDTAMPAMAVAWLRNKKWVLDAHEYFPEVPELVNRPFEKSIWELAERLAVPSANLLFTVSYSIARVYRSVYRTQCEVIRNVPVLDSAPLMNDQRESYLIYRGALNEGRGLENLLLAMYDVNMKLYLAGDGDLMDLLKKRVEQMGLQEKILFTGYQKPEELKARTNHAYLGINLLENTGKSYYYSLGNKFFDYIHSGIPQICINFPEYKKLNDQYEVACLVSDLKAETISNAIKKLTHDMEYYQKLHENCLDARKVFNWQEEEKKLFRLFDRIA